ncbi:s-adenosylmethionine synthase [Diplodia corticola]|uniref:S-adenosylmethionine synthase n=1 Tax=Diplodia corticola TaxID=236234 RepID=A0A1J9RSB5_9PEZI|nr:s-adenosylmethionine synthase [Diplodia corticola]OJD30772.1 s-adenosylmethionine synthase [Diplodia corticola]
MRPAAPAIDWAAVRHAALGFALLAGVKLAAFAFDRGLDTYVGLVTRLFEHEPWVPYEDLVVPNAPRPALDWTRCALLHNRIVELGWLGYNNGSGRDAATRDTTTWWARHQHEAEQIQERLTPDLIDFLQHAQMPEEGLAFTHELAGLAHPHTMFSYLDHFDEGEYMLLLYEAPWDVGGDMFGLAFDKRDNLVHFFPWQDGVGADVNWFPLELALRTYLGMIEAGKYVALPPAQLKAIEERQDLDLVHPPWAKMAWETNGGIERTIAKLDLLMQAIWERMPAEAQTAQRQLRHQQRMISETSLLREHGPAAPRNSFLHLFLTRAAGCPFDYIAPGLKCPTDETIESILAEPPVPESYVADGRDAAALPVLLFPSDERVQDDVDGGDFYGWYKATLTGVLGGLYMDGASHRDSYQDGVQLVTPFCVRQYGWARWGDGREIMDYAWRMYDETRAAHGCEAYVSLFQLGNNAFTYGHHTPLHVILDHWLDLVESGLWAVGADGVEGGMSVFRMADSEEHWWRYCVQPASW